MRKASLFLLLSIAAFQAKAQNNWQDLMHDGSANFFDIQADFNLYYDSVMVGETSIPKGKGIKQFKRWEYYWQNRVDQFGNFPPAGHTLREALDYAEDNANRSYETGTGSWEIVGPTPTPTNGTGQPNGSGRVNCIAFHPTDANTIFVGAPAGGFWKSTDNGSTWTEYSSGLVRLGVSSIVIHPTTPNTIYIATGDRDGGDAPGYGVWRSTDGGVTWASRNNGMGNRTVYEVLMHPTNPDILIAATSGGRIYRSTNGGANWAYDYVGTNCRDIAFHPSNPDIVYGGGGDFVRSTDNGVSFVTVTSGVPNASRIAIGVSADEPNWVYLLGGDGNGLVDLVRSTDSGLNFNSRTTTPNILGWDWDGSDVGSQAWYDLVMAVNPTDADEIYTGGINIWKSTDGGSTMNLSGHWVGSGGADDVHADHHAMEFSPHNGNVYNGNDGGAYYSSDDGTTWTDISSGLAIAQVYKIGISQTVEDLAINGYQDNGTAVSEGTAFRTEIGGDGMECIIDPTDESYMYGSLYYGAIRRSTNNGLSFGNIVGGISEEGGWVTPFKLDPGNASRMYAGFDNVWRTDNVKAGTVAWTSLSSFGGTNNCVDLAIAPSDNNVMYVSRSSGEFYRTGNAQAGSPTWTDLSANLPSSSTPKDIEIDPLDEDHLFIAVSLDIYESTDGGQSWNNYSGSLPNVSLNTIVIDQNSPVEAMYVGMDLGVYYRDMNSADWEAYYTGLPNIEVTELEIYYNTTDCRSAIFAATYAQGLWKSDLKDPGTVAPIACFESDVQVGCTATPITFTDLSSYTPTGWTWSFTPNTVTFVNGTSANSETPEVTFNATGLYSATLTVTNANGSDSELKTDYISIINSVLATPTLTTPANAATDVAPPVSFSWSAVAGTVITYDLDIATDAAFSSIVDAQTGLTTNSYSSNSLSSNTTYYWRVKAFENCAESSFTSTFSFTTGNCAVTSSADVPVVISSSGTPTVTSDLVFGTSGAITSISVASLDIPHTWINDIVVTLESPDGTVITLIDRICAGENDIDVILYDGAPTSINGAACPPNGGGSYQPEDALAAFIGEEASGTWTLSATDHVNQDGGSIDGWSLAICTNSPTCTDPTVPTLSFDTDPICPGATTNLNISGTLNDATSWEVYSTNCGTGLVGSTATSTLSISPSANTTYYVRGEGGCVTPGTCADATITVDDSVNPTITCPANATVNVNGSCQISLADYTGSATVNDNCDSSPAVTQSPAAATLLSGSGTTQTITLTATDASTNSANCTFELTLNDNTNPTITCPSTVTVTANAATCLASPALGSPTTADNCTVGVITNDAPATFPVGNTAVTWTVTDGNSNSANCTQTVTVNTNIPTQPTAISGTNSVCSGDTETYSVTAVADASSYTWSLPSGWTGSSTSNTISVTTGPNPGNISVTANNSCGSSSAQTLAISMQSGPNQPSAITGAAAPCTGSNQTYSVSVVSGATSYNWTLPSGWSGTGTSNSISATVGAGSGNVEVVAVGTCGNSIAQTLSVAPVATPNQPATISGLTTACPSSFQTYSVATVSGATTYTWTLPAGWTGSSTSNSITVSTSTTGGTISVTAVNSCSQAGISQTLAVSVPTVDDGIPCTVDACNPANGVVTNTPDNSVCDDGLWCNGQETCDAILGCQAGTPPTIDDGNSCTDDSCNEALDQVEHVNNSSPCDDGNPNTINDQCVNGVCVGTPIGNVWTGNVNTTWGNVGNWSLFVPTASDDAIIPTSPTGGVFPQIPAGYQASVDNIDVQPGATVNVLLDGTLDVFGVLTNNGIINVNNGGSLLQRTGSTISGSGIYHVQRQGNTGFNYDYWSAPISNQSVVPGTSYLFDSNASTQSDTDDSPSDPGWMPYNGTMQQGKGYAGRGAGLYTFSGTAGNGNVSMPLVYHAFDNTFTQTSAGTPYNLVGNPYPSAISAAQFIADNPNIDGTITFWDDDLSSGSDYHRSDYAYWNNTGGLGTGAGANGAPSGFISTGQGFMVRALNSSASVTFNNAQRVPASNTQFFRADGERSRLWFSVEKENSINQILIGMFEEATTAEDRLYDAAKMSTQNSLSLAAMANNIEHAILAFPPSSESQIVPLLVSTQEAGNYTFKANTVENFNGYQVTFNDVLTNTSIALFQGTVIERYLDEGEYENRFYLNFSPTTVTGLANSVERNFTAYVANDLLNINVNNLDAFDAKIELMDASGRIVYSSTNQPINNGKYTVSLAGLASGVYVVQISTETWTNAQRFIYR